LPKHPSSGRCLPSVGLEDATATARILPRKSCRNGVVMKTLTSRLLFVDEDREFLQQVRNALPRGLCVETVDTASQAIQKLQMGDFDVVGVDREILRSTGLLHWIKENRPLTVCLILTTQPAVTAAATVEQLSGFDYISKPIEPAQLAFGI